MWYQTTNTTRGYDALLTCVFYINKISTTTTEVRLVLKRPCIMYLVYGMERRDMVSAVDRMVGPISPLKMQHVSSVIMGFDDDDNRGAIGEKDPVSCILCMKFPAMAPLLCWMERRDTVLAEDRMDWSNLATQSSIWGALLHRSDDVTSCLHHQRRQNT